MNSILTRQSRAWLALMLAVMFPHVTYADLFALFNSGNIARINSTTGAIIDTYSGIGASSTNSGLTFDGQRLYLNRRTSSVLDEIWAFEIATQTWMQYGVLETASIDLTGSNLIAGMGYTAGLFGEGSLVTVTRRQVDRPSYVVQYSVFPPFDIYFPNFPFAVLPDDVDALGADYDPATGEFWISAERVEMTTRTPVLLRADFAGNVEQEILPSLGPAAIPRGLAFDDGGMFIGVRHLPTVTNEIHKIDRATGAILDSFVISGNGSVVALAGGVVIPEPATAVLCAMIVLLGVNRRQ